MHRMAQSGAKSKTVKQQLEEADESLRSKFLEIVESLSLTELKRFDKFKYKAMVMSEMTDIVPEADKNDIDDKAQYVSNMLNTRAKRLKNSKMTSQQHDRRRTRRSQAETTNLTTKKDTPEAPIIRSEQSNTELSETFVKALDATMSDANDSLNSTVTNSFLDDTYDNNGTNEDSITEVKRVGRSNAENPSGGTTSESETINIIELDETEDLHDKDDEIRCIESCLSNKDNGDSLRCNLCMVWFHTACLGITDIDAIGAWVCGTCRQMPKTVKLIQSQIDTIMSSTNKILQTFANFSEKLEQNFVNLNDRVTAISNQNKLKNQDTTSTMADIRQEIKIFKSDVEKKTDTIVSKSCSIFDKVKATADLVNNIKDNQFKVKATSDQLSNDTSSYDNVTEAQKGQTQSTNSQSKTPPRNHNVNSTQENRNPVQEKQKPLPKRDLTFITGSGILKSIDTKFLSQNVRVKSFQNAKIDSLKDKLTNMDLSRYEKIILHIGGNDIDEKITHTAFKNKYQSLLTFISTKTDKIFVSGLLPRGGINIKPYNNILKELSVTANAKFIDNHNSFILASGEQPFEFFQADMVHLKFPGTRVLVNNMNTCCPVLPTRLDTRNHVDQHWYTSGRGQRHGRPTYTH